MIKTGQHFVHRIKFCKNVVYEILRNRVHSMNTKYDYAYRCTLPKIMWCIKLYVNAPPPMGSKNTGVIDLTIPVKCSGHLIWNIILNWLT